MGNLKLPNESFGNCLKVKPYLTKVFNSINFDGLLREVELWYLNQIFIHKLYAEIEKVYLLSLFIVPKRLLFFH